jgi:hypothetical protein
MRLSGPVCLLVVPVLAAAAPAARGEDGLRVKPGAVLDFRAGHVDAAPAWLQGGLGKLRYGEGGDAGFVRLPQASLLLKVEMGDSLDVRGHVNVDAEPGAEERQSRVAPVEAYLAYHPALSPAFTVRARAGLLYPLISLEHPGPAWTTAYSITPSAANTWVGEDLRATGAEVSLVLTRGRHEVTATGGAFGWNDPAGTLLAWRGWALHDRQTGAGDHLPLAPLPCLRPDGLFPKQAPFTAPTREVDDRAGYYAGAAWSWSGRALLRGLYYDNRSDVTAVREGQYAWATRFASAGLQAWLPGSLELLAQYLSVRSDMGRLPDGSGAVSVAPRTACVLLTGSWGRHRLTVRRDWFSVADRGPIVAEDDNAEDGSAWTAAYLLRTGNRHRVAVEAVRLDSTRPARATLSAPVRAREVLLQVSFRVSL